jgi:hypothetical protein
MIELPTRRKKKVELPTRRIQQQENSAPLPENVAAAETHVATAPPLNPVTWSGEKPRKQKQLPQPHVEKPVDIHATIPHSPEAEMGVLSSILQDFQFNHSSRVIEEAASKITPQYFHIPANKTVYEMFLSLWKAGAPIDFISFTQILRDRGLLDTVGGPGFIAQIQTFVPTAAGIAYYLEIMREQYAKREMIAVGTRMVRAAYGSHEDDVSVLLDSFSSGFERIKLGFIEINEPAELPPAPPPYKPPPVGLLPSVLQDYAYALAESINVDVGFSFFPLLTTVATAIGHSRSILLKRGFVQPPVIWTIEVGRSGCRKSPTIDAATFAITEHELELIRQNQEATEIYEEELAKWEGQSKKVRGPKPQPPPSLTCFTDDLTIEALADLLVMNPRGVIVRKDELSHLFASFDQYKDRTKGSDVARWLSLHSAFPLAIDRRSDNRHYRIMNPRVNITGGIQPKILGRSLTPEFFERGLPARFIFVYPPFRQDRWNEATVPDKLRRDVLKLFERLWLLQPSESNPLLLTFKPDAKAAFIDFYNQCGESALEASEPEEATWGKLSGYGSRFALVGQVAHDHRAESVTKPITQNACELALWSGDEARRIYSELAETPEQRELRSLCEFVERRGGTATVRDAMQNYRPFRSNREKAEHQFNAAVKAGLARWEPVPTTPKGGAPTRLIRLIPDCRSTQPPALIPDIRSTEPRDSRERAGGSVDVDTREVEKNTRDM